MTKRDTKKPVEPGDTVAVVTAADIGVAEAGFSEERIKEAERAEKAEGRKASAPLYVMVTHEQKRRYERAAAYAGMTMREYVVNALEAQVAQQNAAQIEALRRLASPDDDKPQWPPPHWPADVGTEVRLSKLEKQIELLNRRLEALEPSPLAKLDHPRPKSG